MIPILIKEYQGWLIVRKGAFFVATFRVLWDELSPNAKYPNRKGTTVQASSMAEAKSKVKQRVSRNVKISNMTAVKL